MTEKTPPRSFPFATRRRSCVRCGAVTFYVRMDGVAVCPRHMKKTRKEAQPTRKDRDGTTRGEIDQ